MFSGRPEAKVNLTLQVAGLRRDGFHELRSIFMRIGLCDRLTVQLAPEGTPADALTIDGLAGVPVEGNLVLRAFDALRAHIGAPLPVLEATLQKQIPSAAGLGGGSSDASAALVLAQLAWGISLEPSELSFVGASIGSDVPFFLADETLADVGGRGEIVDGLPGKRLRLGLLVVTPPIELSTGRVFAEHDRLPRYASDAEAASDALIEILWDEPNDEDVIAWSSLYPETNDLWPAAAALEPRLPELRDRLQRHTSAPWLMSGSGPTLFALYPSVEEAAEAGMSLVGDWLSVV
jgi:4-diphosphocytidyl-2-C-methyl-D-erythritol kinase